MTDHILLQSANAIAASIAGNEADPVDVVRQSFDRAREVGADRGGLNIFVSSDPDGARLDAARLRAAVPLRGTHASSGLGMPLLGVAVAVKDNIATLRLPTTCGSRILAEYTSPFEATVVRRLRDAGALVIAKTNMDEFAMGSSTENSAYGPTRNPLDPTRVPGGSSGGSAAAVAAGLVRIALGSETGGSVRQPAAFCGVVGVKPTYGRVSRYGLVAFASSLDQVGVFGRSVDDAALAMEVISGRDVLDSTTSAEPLPSYRGVRHPDDLAGVVIGIPAEYFPESLDVAVRAHCERAIRALESLGASVRPVSLPHTALAIPVYYIIAPAEASSNLARFDGVRYGLRVESDGLRAMYDATRSAGFGPEVTRRILLGTYVLSAGYYDAYYRKAQQVRALIARDFASVFNSGVDALFTPTTPTPAFEIGAKSDPYEMYLSDIFTATANLAGVPAMSVPIGRVGGLPVGGQIIAAHYGEPAMFRIAYALERVLGSGAHA